MLSRPGQRSALADAAGRQQPLRTRLLRRRLETGPQVGYPGGQHILLAFMGASGCRLKPCAGLSTVPLPCPALPAEVEQLETVVAEPPKPIPRGVRGRRQQLDNVPAEEMPPAEERGKPADLPRPEHIGG